MRPNYWSSGSDLQRWCKNESTVLFSRNASPHTPTGCDKWPPLPELVLLRVSQWFYPSLTVSLCHGCVDLFPPSCIRTSSAFTLQEDAGSAAASWAGPSINASFLRVREAELQHRPPLSSTFRILIHTLERWALSAATHMHTNCANSAYVCACLLKHHWGARKHTSCVHLHTLYIHLCACVCVFHLGLDTHTHLYLL